MQNTLFGKPKVKVEKVEKWEEKLEESSAVEELIESDEDKSAGGWADYNHQEILSNKKTEGCCYTHLSLSSISDLNGITYKTSVTSASENPNGILGSCWGSGGNFDIDKPKVFFDELMEDKLKDQKEPYKKMSSEMWEVGFHFDSSDFYRLIPLKNYMVIVSKKFNEMLKEKGFDFEKWYEEYRAIEENPATEEYDNQIGEARKILEKGTNLMKKVDLIKKSIRYKLGETRRYSSDNHDYFTDVGVDELLSRLNQIHKEIYDINKELLERFFKNRYDKYEAFSLSSIKDVI